MNIQSTSDIPLYAKATSPKQKEKKMALDFEKLFARHIVQEMTKGLFKPADKNSIAAAGSGLYRAHIVDTLAQELADQHKLGISDMITRYINQTTGKKG